MPTSPTVAGQGLPLFGRRRTVALIVVASLAVTCAMTYVLYRSMQHVFRVGIDERLTSIASVGAVSFTPQLLDRIHGPESVGTAAYEQAVRQLQYLRASAPNVRFAYILRRTDDPNRMEFVADADSLHPEDKVDLNGDGVINDEDALTSPGDPYDVSPFPEFRAAAFLRPFVDPDFTTSQWGIFLSGTAPIRDPDAPTTPAHYVLGIDLAITQYWALLQQVIVPFAAFAILLFVVISLQALALRALWRRQVRQLQEIDRQKDELLSIVSHQLGGPITAMRWTLEGLHSGDSGPLTPPQQKEVGGMMQAAATLNDLVSLLLDLSRIELGRLAVNKRPVNLHDFFDELLQAIGVLARQKGVTLDSHVPADLPTASVDPRLTRMALENLLNNAVKYTPVGGQVTFTVSVAAAQLHCRIQDTGCGIPPDEQPLLFTKLFRASNVRDTVPGNGFGLYIAQGAVVQQGGKLHCESMLGRGTTFDVTLPIR